MNIGSLDKKVAFLSQEEVENEFKITELKPVEKLKCWARIEPARGKEYYEATKVRTESSYKITIRYRANLNESMLIKYGSRQFEIQDILDPYERHVMLECYCTEKKRGEGAST